LKPRQASKGTLIDAYGPYADIEVDEFMKEVESIDKKTIRTTDEPKAEEGVGEEINSLLNKGGIQPPLFL